MIHLHASDSKGDNAEADEAGDLKFRGLAQVCGQKVSRLKGLHGGLGGVLF